MMSLIDDIKRDREAGTQGPWVVAKDRNKVRRIFAGDSGPQVATASVFANWMPVERSAEAHATADVNARRIARVPEMEAALIEAAKLADALEAYMRAGAGPLTGWIDVEDALAAYRKATGADT